MFHPHALALSGASTYRSIMKTACQDNADGRRWGQNDANASCSLSSIRIILMLDIFLPARAAP